jgi:hypothetical protein
MNKVMNIIDLYKSILDCGNLSTDKDGFVSVKITGSPVLVGGKRLVLPTQNQLTSSDWNEKIRFHPLNENILRGESEIITKLRSVFNIRLNYTFAAIAQNLIAIVASTAEHHLLNPEQSEMLSAISEVDETTLELFNKITIAAIKEAPDKAFINVFLKRGGTIAGKKYSRVGVVTFPLYEELKNADQELFHGIKLRVKDKLSIKQLYEYILPNLDKAESYNFGSDSNIAPFLHALMGTILGVGSKFNDILELFSKEIDDTEMLLLASDWVDTFENLGEMLSQIRSIPMQQGNEGSIKIVDAQPGVQQPISVPQAPQALTYQAPAPQNVYTAPVPQAMPQPMPWQHPGQPQMQPQLQQQPGLVITENGLDFNSLLRSKPQVAAMGMNMGQPQMFQPQYQERTPTWAIPQQSFGYPQQQQQFSQQQQFPQAFNQNVQGFSNQVRVSNAF